MKKRYWLIVYSLVCVLTIGKELVEGRTTFLPDFSFILNQVEDDFDPRDTSGRVPLNLQEAKNNLRYIFYFGLAADLRNRNLPIISETLRQIEKVLDLASKFFHSPFPIPHSPFVPAILPPIKDFLEKFFIIQKHTAAFWCTTIFFVVLTYHLSPITYHLSFALFSLSKTVLRL